MSANGFRVRRSLIYAGATLIWVATTAMHIPDGYLSPVTCLIMFLMVIPFWASGLRNIRSQPDARRIPLISLMAAFSFVVMMFNLPLPGGTSGHAVGAALAGILLGPASATIAISIALVIQALFFGDGGVLALGANCFNIGVVAPYVAVGVYRLVTRRASTRSNRRILGAAMGGWFGLTTAALIAGAEFGLQPILFHTADGTPLYAPYPLAIAVPAMVLPHAAVASVAEGLLTALVLGYLQRANPAMIPATEAATGVQNTELSASVRWLLITVVILIVAAPLGLLTPGTAWGEWGQSELARMGLGDIPGGLSELSNLWGAPLASYRVPALGDAPLGYLISAALGVFVVTVLTWLFTALLWQTGPRRD